MNSLQEFVNMLQLSYKGDYENGVYVIRLNSSDDFSDIYTQVSLNKKLEPDGDSQADTSSSVFRFTDGYFEVTLQANYDSDRYLVEIGER